MQVPTFGQYHGYVIVFLQCHKHMESDRLSLCCLRTQGGKSGLHRVGRWITSSGGDLGKVPQKQTALHPLLCPNQQYGNRKHVSARMACSEISEIEVGAG